VRRRVHRTIERVTHDVDGRFHFNTALAAIMELVNALSDARNAAPPAATHCGPEPDACTRAAGAAEREAYVTLLRLLSPFAPHLCDELWERLGLPGTALQAGWPTFDPAVAAEETITVAVQVSGKLRGQVALPAGAPEADAVAAAKAEPNVARHLEGKTIVKTIYVPGRLVNFVAR
jgi:leucyl-tRNA synthetase